MYLSLVASQGGGIHVEEEFDLWIRVNGSFSPGKYRIQIGMFRPIRVDHTNCLQVAIKTHSFVGNFVLAFIVKICSSLMFRIGLICTVQSYVLSVVKLSPEHSRSRIF